MKKYLLVFSVILGFFLNAPAEKKQQRIDVYTIGHDQKSTTVHRAPARIPAIEVYYDSEVQTIEVVGDEYVEAEVFLYDEEGIVVDYSTSLNTIFSVSVSGSYRIHIQSANWYAEGEIQI